MATVVSVLYFGLFALVLGWAGVLVWQWRALPGFAGEVYDSNVEKGLLNGKIPREAYIESYVRSEGPRLGTYRCATAFVSLLILPSLISFFSRMTDAFVYRNDVWLGPFNVLQIAIDFSIILVVMGIFLAGLFFVTRYYYRTAPPSLSSEVKRLEGDTA